MKNLLAGKPWMLGNVKLTELFVAELPHDAESGDCRSNDQRHGVMVQTGLAKAEDAVDQARMSPVSDFIRPPIGADLGHRLRRMRSPAARHRAAQCGRRT